MKDTGNVPAHEVPWKVTYDANKGRPVKTMYLIVYDRSWFGAREQAMKLMGCGPDDIVVERADDQPKPGIYDV